jgi:glycosyltransferase involved in cell wall biosynthesis
VTRIAILSPAAPGGAGGNVTTRRRIARGLRGRGLEVLEVSVTPAGAVEGAAGGLEGADLVHALHAWKAGRLARELSRRLGVSYVVSLTGTDIHEDIESPERRDAVLEVLAGAAAILAPGGEAEEIVRRHGIATPLVRVAKGIEVPEPAGAPAGADERDGALFLLPGGWREVKNQLFALDPLARLAAEVPGVRLRFAGPVLDAAYHALWAGRRERLPFAEDAGVVAPAGMGREYAAAAVVLNTSHSEGGSNAVLEAMAAGRAVLASDVPGNRALVDFRPDDWRGSTGVLYRTEPMPGGGPARRAHDAEDFLVKARRLALEPDLRATIGRNARERARAEHSPERESEDVLSAYRIAGVGTPA